MNYKVRWEKRVLDSLASIWLDSDEGERKRITAVTHALDVRLSRDPHNEGESRADNRRITFEPPFVVVFRVDDEMKSVWVLEMRSLRRK